MANTTPPKHTGLRLQLRKLIQPGEAFSQEATTLGTQSTGSTDSMGIV